MLIAVSKNYLQAKYGMAVEEWLTLYVLVIFSLFVCPKFLKFNYVIISLLMTKHSEKKWNFCPLLGTYQFKLTIGNYLFFIFFQKKLLNFFPSVWKVNLCQMFPIFSSRTVFLFLIVFVKKESLICFYYICYNFIPSHTIF